MFQNTYNIEHSFWIWEHEKNKRDGQKDGNPERQGRGERQGK